MKYLIIVILFSLLIVGCTTQAPTAPIQISNNVNNAPDTNTPSILSPASSSPYEGKILAGNKTPYIEFNTADYQKALSDGKLIFLYFYKESEAQSRSEEAKLMTAFSSMGSPRVIGFRVHYGDAVTTPAETKLALELGIEDSDTKIILKDKKVAQRSTDSWAIKTYSQQIFSYLN